MIARIEVVERIVKENNFKEKSDELQNIIRKALETCSDLPVRIELTNPFPSLVIDANLRMLENNYGYEWKFHQGDDFRPPYILLS